MSRYHIVIEGTNEEQMSKFFEEVQNKYNLYDNCVFEECSDEDSFIEKEDRCEETGDLICTRPIRRIKVKSSNIDFVSYEESKQELSVWFKSRKNEEHYVYSNVSVITFSELMKAESKGSYFAKKIKGNEFTKKE